jgi:hypothetical protein
MRLFNGLQPIGIKIFALSFPPCAKHPHGCPISLQRPEAIGQSAHVAKVRSSEIYITNFSFTKDIVASLRLRQRHRLSPRSPPDRLPDIRGENSGEAEERESAGWFRAVVSSGPDPRPTAACILADSIGVSAPAAGFRRAQTTSPKRAKALGGTRLRPHTNLCCWRAVRSA